MKKLITMLICAAITVCTASCSRTDEETSNNMVTDDMITESLSIYLCDDVYRTADTPTHGSGIISIPLADSEYKLYDAQLLLCDDGCDPAAVVSRASQGYAVAYRIVQTAEYTGKDSYNYPTRQFSAKIPEPMLEDLQNQGVLDNLKAQLEREYYYLLTLDDTHYAYISIIPTDENSEKPFNEESIVNEFIKNAKIEFTPIAEKTVSEHIGETESKHIEDKQESELYNRTVEFLEQEFHRVYDPHYDIQSLTVSNWNEHGNESTFFYTMAFSYYGEVPEVNAGVHEVNYEFKIVLNDDSLELYTNVSPKDVVWESIEIDDYVLGS